VKIDRLEAMLVCCDCGKEINPIEWIAFMAEHWHRIQDLTRRYSEAKVSYEAKKACRLRALRSTHEGEARDRGPGQRIQAGRRMILCLSPAEIRAERNP